MLSIVIPTLNEEKYLPRILSSIKSQDFSDYEIIVSDGGSSDKTAEIARQYGARVVVDSSVRHPSFQRNTGASVACGEALLFLDADSVLPAGFLTSAWAEFRERGLVGAGFYVRFNPNKPAYAFYATISNFICFLKQATRHPAAIGAGLMSVRSAHESIHGFDMAVVLAEDYDYCERLSRIGRFRIIRSTRLLYSARRIEREGFWLAGWKWLKMGTYTLTHRKIKKEIIKYDFGKF